MWDVTANYKNVVSKHKLMTSPLAGQHHSLLSFDMNLSLLISFHCWIYASDEDDERDEEEVDEGEDDVDDEDDDDDEIDEEDEVNRRKC